MSGFSAIEQAVIRLARARRERIRPPATRLGRLLAFWRPVPTPLACPRLEALRQVAVQYHHGERHDGPDHRAVTAFLDAGWSRDDLSRLERVIARPKGAQLSRPACRSWH